MTVKASKTEAAAAAWERFWFQPGPTSTLALLRISVGLITLGWTVSLAPDLDAFFGQTGVLPNQPRTSGVWGVLGVFPSDLAVQLLFAALLVAAIALIIGYHARLAAVVVFVGILSFERRNPFVFNTGDGLLRMLAFFVMLAPGGASLSVDRWRDARDRFWEFPLRSQWVLRLMQVQLSILYLSAVWDKVRGVTWNDGTAVSYAFRISDITRLPLPDFFTHSALIGNLMTYGTLLVELSVPLLVWNRRLRPWVLLAGASLHLGIEYSIRVGFFSMAMLALYLSWLDPSWAQAKILSLRDAWLERSRVRAPHPLAARDPLPRSLTVDEPPGDHSEPVPLPEH